VFAGCLAFLAPCALNLATAADDGTPIELVAYGNAHETNELFRYDFASDTFSTVGVVTDQSGKVVDEPTALAYIPQGPLKGLYCAGDNGGYLFKIDPLTADATKSSQTIGWNKVMGMTAFWAGSDWLLLANDNNKDLITIDPATGVGTFRCKLTNKYKALAMDHAGFAYGVEGANLWAIDLAQRISGDTSAEWKVGSGSFSKVEALEFAYADFSAGDEEDVIPGLGLGGGGWFDKGLLLGFSENTALIVVNPSTGASVEYPCSFATLDFEGLVFLDANWDGWGQITVNAHD
jgi:hypothetical protein